MESLSKTDWDVIISGTGLQQSLLALSLSRTGKSILHIDVNEYYGGAEAALSLQEIDEWVSQHAVASTELTAAIFSNAHLEKAEEGLSFSRSYSVALAPQIIHARSELLAQLVSSKAFRQLEFLAVGSFYIYTPSSADASIPPSLSRVPSTREEVFADTTIPSKSKRALMKFLKFVLDYEAEPQTELWKPKAADPLVDFLVSDFKLDANLQASILAMTLSLDGKVTVEEGLKAITRHLSSMGRFGAGFAAVYPKWGGLSEVAQVGCRAGAVGGATYMLGSSMVQCVRADDRLHVTISDGTRLKAKRLIRGPEGPKTSDARVSRLSAIISAECSSLLQPTLEGSPVPAVALVSFPPNTVALEDGSSSEYPIYANIHSSDTGECPAGQSIIYLSTVYTENAFSLLKASLSRLLDALVELETRPAILCELYYDQAGSTAQNLDVEEDRIATFPSPSVDLAFSDHLLDPPKEAWKIVIGSDGVDVNGEEYMRFDDREGVEEEDDEST